jgi:hypothetical protein
MEHSGAKGRERPVFLRNEPNKGEAIGRQISASLIELRSAFNRMESHFGFVWLIAECSELKAHLRQRNPNLGRMDKMGKASVWPSCWISRNINAF